MQHNSEILLRLLHLFPTFFDLTFPATTHLLKVSGDTLRSRTGLRSSLPGYKFLLTKGANLDNSQIAAHTGVFA
jgi:hypothetical protein